MHAIIARGHIRAFQGLGLSIGPFMNMAQANEVEHFLANFTRLVVRDTPSLDYLDGSFRDRAVLGGDLAALYRYPPARRSEKHIHIGIMPCATVAVDDQSYIDSVTRAVAAIESSTGRLVRVTVLALNNNPVVGDDALVNRVAFFLKARGRIVTTARYIDIGVEGTVDAISTMDYAFPTRLHGAIVSYLVDTPFAFLEYQDKCSHFSRDVGLPTILRLSAISEPGAWISAARAMLAGAKPSMSPDSYQERAEKAYVDGYLG